MAILLFMGACVVACALFYFGIKKDARAASMLAEAAVMLVSASSYYALSAKMHRNDEFEQWNSNRAHGDMELRKARMMLAEASRIRSLYGESEWAHVSQRRSERRIRRRQARQAEGWFAWWPRIRSYFDGNEPLWYPEPSTKIRPAETESTSRADRADRMSSNPSPTVENLHANERTTIMDEREFVPTPRPRRSEIHGNKRRKRHRQK